MCGINGVYSQSPLSNSELRIQKMNSALNHRGPDADGTYNHENRLVFGHRRLKIIDLSEKANQPFIGSIKGTVLVFNGEIYNYKIIKQKLDYPFQTNSDTEVIIAAIETKGIDWFLNNANGMFAFAAFDKLSGDLFLVRDRLGIKPLYYTISDGMLIFSSEIKGILASGLIHAEFNSDSIDEYLANRYIREPFTFFKNIYQVESGHYIHITNNFIKKTVKYWELPPLNLKNESYNEHSMIDGVEEKLFESINRRLISDVPLGTYLSGGIDSSLITSIVAKEKRDEQINTYTIGFDEKGFNEFEYSDIVAKQENTRHHTILMNNKDYIEKIENLIKFKDAPLGVPNEVPLAEMSKKLKEKITVVLSGEGADELFGGYGRIFRSYFDYKNLKVKNTFYDYFINKYDYVPRNIRDNFLTTSKNFRDYFDTKIKNEFEGNSNKSNIFKFFHNYHIKGLLLRLDATTMHTSVEGRVPFVDHELIEYVYQQVPFDLKLKWKNKNFIHLAKKQTANEYSEVMDIPKYILKQVALRHIPATIVNRKKIGFPVPLNNWLDEIEKLSYELLYCTDWLKKENLSNLISNIKNEPRAGQILWMFLNVEMFKRIYFDKNYKW